MRTVTKVLFGSMAVYALLLYLLASYDMGAVREYSIPTSSPMAKAYGVQTTSIDTGFTDFGDVVHTYTRIDGETGADDDECGKSFNPLAVFPSQERLHLKTTSRHMWLYDCSAQEKDGDDEDDNDDDYSHCPRWEIDRNDLHNKRFKDDRVQRLFACPPKSDGGPDCPADSNDYAAMGNPSNEFDWENCEVARTDRDCAKKIKFNEDQYVTGAIAIVYAYVIGVALASIGFESGEEFAKPVKMIGALLILAGHITALILGGIWLANNGAIHDSDEKCVGAYLEETMGMNLEEESAGAPFILVLVQVILTGVGAILFGVDIYKNKLDGDEFLL